jgi:SAM-dependent methyltransferase
MSTFDPSKLEHESVYESIMDARIFLKGYLLDLGSGEQPYASIARNGASQYFTLDIVVNNTTSPDVCADSLALPFKNSSFDSILCTQVLEHVKNPFVLFQQVSRILRDDGHLILTAPQAWPLHEEPFDFFRYTKYGLSLLAEQAGLKVVMIKERRGGIVAVGQLLSMALYDKLGKNAFTRIPLKVFLVPFISTCKFLDTLWFYPKFTLGYLLVAMKKSVPKEATSERS